MNNPVKICISRAPDLIPAMVVSAWQAPNPLILVPESFTLAAEQALVQSSPGLGLIGTQVLSPTSLVREIRERAGFPDKKVISGDGRNMILSLLLMKNRGSLSFYKENVHQITMAEKLAAQIDDLTDAGFRFDSLRKASEEMKDSTSMKCRDIAFLWEEYEKFLSRGFIDQESSWRIALDRLEASGLMNDTDLLICGFDCINLDLTLLIAAAYPLARSITVSLVSETGGPDDHIFELAANSVKRFVRRISRPPFRLPAVVEKYCPPANAAAASPRLRRRTDPALRYLERHVYALENSREPVPDMAAVSVYFAPDTTSECLHAAQTLIEWHRQGIAWHDMAVAVCDETVIPALLPLVLASSGVPFSLRSGSSMLLSEYAQFFLAVLGCLKSGFAQEDVLRLLKTRFTGLSDDEVMDLENYAREYGIDHKRWQNSFPEDSPAAARLESSRAKLIGPLATLRSSLSARTCTGRTAAQALYEYLIASGAYQVLLQRERELLGSGEAAAADRNRQAFTAVNELLDQLAVFAENDHLPLTQLCLMLESSVSAKMIKSLPQEADSVLISSPNMFFSSGIRAGILMGMQDSPAAPPSALLTPSECSRLASSASGGQEDSGIGMTRREAAARAKQDIYQALACICERLMVSCSAALPGGRVLTPSQAYRDISALVSAGHPENVLGGLTDDGLVPFSPQFALERLAVMLRDAKSGRSHFLSSDDPRDALWQQALSFLYHHKDWHDRMQSVLGALHVRLESPGISGDLARELYLARPLSVSALETAGTCLYRAFLTYALRARPRREFSFEADARGTFYHRVLKRFFESAMQEPGWPVLDESCAARLFDRTVREETRLWNEGPLGKNLSGRYRGGEIIRTVRTAVMSMVKSLREQPHFSPLGMEVGFGDSPSDSPIHFPQMSLSLEDGQAIPLSGVIDRIDTLRLDDGRNAFLVYDFKSGIRQVRLQAIEAGLQLQLPIYLMAAGAGLPGHIPAGALYQPVKDVLISAEDGNARAIEEGVNQELRPRGLFLDDEELLKAGTPFAVPKRTGAHSDILGVLSPEAMEDVLRLSRQSAGRVISRMLSGRTTPNPLQDGGLSPCDTCQMRPACPLDSRLEGGRVRKLDHALSPVEE